MKNIQLLILTQLFYSILCFNSGYFGSNYFLSSNNHFNSNYFVSLSNNHFNSNYFVSLSNNHFNSNYFVSLSNNHFNSNYFVSLSNNHFNSNYFVSSYYKLNSYFLYYTSNNNNVLTLINSINLIQSTPKLYTSSCTSNKYNILSYINSVFYTSSITKSLHLSISTSFTTIAPILSPTIVPTTAPTIITTLSPTIITTLSPTTAPTIVPTITPTIVPTIVPTITPTIVPTFITTLSPTTSPTFITTLSPTFITTLSPTFITTLSPTTSPTFITTLSPTLSPTILVAPIISFNTKISFDNYKTNELDDNSKKVVILATANSMNISDKYVEYVGSEIKNRRRLIEYIIKIKGYNIAIILQTNIPLQGKYASFINNPSMLYQTITKSLVNAVNTGTFTKFLQAASNGLNITSFSNSTILSIESDPFIIKDPSPKKDKKDKTDVESILYVLLFSFLLVCVIKLFYVLKEKKWNITCIKNRGALSLQEISISNV